ncbi:MAG: (2Fe-2S)-binding protein [Gammaproteobacteria bacterium]
MYVCICKAVTDKAIRAAVLEGTRTLDGLHKELGCSGQCGRCEPHVLEIRDEVIQQQTAQGLAASPSTLPGFSSSPYQVANAGS